MQRKIRILEINVTPPNITGLIKTQEASEKNKTETDISDIGQTSIDSSKRLRTRACKCSGQIGSLFLDHLDHFSETKLAETLLQPSKMALTKLLLHGFGTSHELWKKFAL